MMILENKTLSSEDSKSFSAGKSILAVLWHKKEVRREDIVSHRYIKLLCGNKSKTTYRTCISRLSSQKLINKNEGNFISLSDKGKKKGLAAFIEAETRLYKNDELSWDGVWRLVFFDIPEKKRKFRDYLRRILKTVGFREFQKSIWAYPYPVPTFIKELLFDEEVRSHVKFVIASSIDDDGHLRNIFNLSSPVLGKALSRITPVVSK